MSKTYISNVTRRNPQPRSKRLKAGATTSSSSTVVSLSAGTGASGNNTDHTHDNLADLNKIGTTDGYLMLTELDKESGSPQTNKVKAGWADGSNYANDSAHADNADEASHAETADSSTQWDGHSWQDWLDQPLRSFDAVRFQSVTCNDLHSVQTFVDGLLGSGYRLWTDDEGVSHLAIDKLTVRQTMKVMELIVEKIRSIGGALVVSASNGRISQVTEHGDSFIIAFEQDNNFVTGDLIRCSVANGQTTKSYWVEVSEVTDEGVVVDKASFPSNVVPAEGDECVLMGNTLNPSRQNLVMISATEDGQPRIDVLNGVHSTSLDGCLRARLGNLDGISDNWFAPDSQPHGDGLYSDNVYLKGKFLLENGEDVKTRFEATEGLIASMVEGLRQDVLQEKGYLNNATFGSGMDMWKTSNEAVFYMLGNKWLWVNDKVLTKLGNCAVVVNDQGRTVVHIRNNYITQKNCNLRNTPDIQTLGNGMREPVAVYLSFYYRCASPGTLNVTFENVNTSGFETFTSMNVTKQLTTTEGYEQFTCSGLWNGTGDFKLTFTGDIYLYMLCLSLDKTEALAYRYRTLFEQTANLVKICAAVYDRDATAISETGLFIKPTGAGIYVQNADGSVSFIGAFDNGTIKLQASNIKLEGLITAGGNFKILNDGSIEAQNGKFGGQVNATSGSIGGFNIGNNRIGIDKDSGSSGLFLYDYMIGFNATDRQAIIGTLDSLGTPMLCRLIDTSSTYLPKYGIIFNIAGSNSMNHAFVGNGSGSLNGFIDGYKFKKIDVDQANKIYDVQMSDCNRIIVNSTASDSGISLPRLSNVRSALAIDNSTPFVFRFSILADLLSSKFKVFGRNTEIDGEGNTPWDTNEYPLFTDWNGDRLSSLEMNEGDSLEVMLVYDPSRTSTIDGFPIKYTARVINRHY